MRFLAAPALALAAALLGSKALALPPPCAPRGEVVAALQNQFGERVVARGLSGDGAMVELFATPDGATWTIVITLPGNVSCPGGAGRAWQAVVPSPKKMGLKL